MIYEFDLQMARVMKALRDKGVEQDTLVIFTTNAIAQYSDILPTMIDAAGGTAPDDLDGKSLVPLIRGETKVHREKAFFVHNNRHDDRKQDPLFSLRAVTDGRYKLIWNLTPQYMYATKNINGGDDGHLEGEGVRIADTHS